MDAFDVSELLARSALSGPAYDEFLRVPSMSCGVYRLPAGATDPQGPHTEDEIYHVIAGRASIRLGEADRAVEPGSIVYVAAGTPHRFHSIVEDLSMLVVFAPAEGSRAGAAATERRPPGPRRSRPRLRRR